MELIDTSLKNILIKLSWLEFSLANDGDLLSCILSDSCRFNWYAWQLWNEKYSAGNSNPLWPIEPKT